MVEWVEEGGSPEKERERDTDTVNTNTHTPQSAEVKRERERERERERALYGRPCLSPSGVPCVAGLMYISFQSFFLSRLDSSVGKSCLSSSDAMYTLLPRTVHLVAVRLVEGVLLCKYYVYGYTPPLLRRRFFHKHCKF